MIVLPQEGKVFNAFAFVLLLEMHSQRPLSTGVGQELGLAATELNS